MAQYIDLVNKVLDESGSEADELTSGTWTSAEAGRRIYPRVKRNVAEAWTQLQMDRGEWLFMTKEMSTIINPRVKLQNGTSTLSDGNPSIGTVFASTNPNNPFSLTVSTDYSSGSAHPPISDTGAWNTGTADGQLEFVTYTGDRPNVGDIFVEVSPVAGDHTFVYTGKGSYTFLEIDPNLRNIMWTTFCAFQSNVSNNPVVYIPWDHWLYTELEYTQGSQCTPLYVSQDYQGSIVFYPQTLAPFRISFIYEQGPQLLTNYSDTPSIIPVEYHNWIAWEALCKLAMYDKNTDLYAYAKKEALTYATRAERNLMPIPSWGRSTFNE
jgi:hypothetical protein